MNKEINHVRWEKHFTQRLSIVGGIADDDVDSGEEDVSKEF